MLSFVGSFIQRVAQQELIFDLTGSYSKMGQISFWSSIPVAIVGPFAGLMVDIFHKRGLLVVTQVIFAAASGFLAVATYRGWITFDQMLIVAIITGFTSAFEMPTRQATLSSVVPFEDLSAAIPLNSLTFNSARLIGPAIGGILIGIGGPGLCYSVDAASYFFLIFAALAIKSDLSTRPRTEPIKDLIFEGVWYTLRDVKLRTLFILESITAGFALLYLAVLKAYTQDVLHLNTTGYALSMSAIGIGTISALVMVSMRADQPDKKPLLLGSMATISVGTILAGFVHVWWIAIPLFIVVGGGIIIQFNTTNALFQTLAPPRLRGRVLSMHMWALSGIGPFGVLWLSDLAEATKNSSFFLRGIPLGFVIGGVAVGLGAIWGTRQHRAWAIPKTPVATPEPEVAPAEG